MRKSAAHSSSATLGADAITLEARCTCRTVPQPLVLVVLAFAAPLVPALAFRALASLQEEHTARVTDKRTERLGGSIFG